MCPGLCVLRFKYLAAPTRRTTETQELELVYQIIVFTKLTGSISSTLSFPQFCCCVLVHIYLKTLTEDFLNFLSSISSVCLSSSCFILCLRFSVLGACLHFIMMTMLVFHYVYI